MAGKKIISSLIIVGVLAASASTAAVANDRHGDGAAIAAGIVGAVVIGSLIANSQPTYAPPQTYYQPQPNSYYVNEAPVYYQQPAPMYYEQRPQYYAPASVTIYGGNYGDRSGYYHHRRDGYYGRR